MSLFGAGWTAGSLKYLAEGGAHSLTYYETTGPDGRVLAGEQAAPEIFSRLWRWRWAAVLFRLPGAQIPSRVRNNFV